MFACVKKGQRFKRVSSTETTNTVSEVQAPALLKMKVCSHWVFRKSFFDFQSIDRIYSDLSPVNFTKDIDLGPEQNATLWEDPVGASFEHDGDQTLDHFDHKLEEDFQSFSDDETVMMNFDQSYDLHTPPPPNLLPTSSILRKNVRIEEVSK